VLCPMSFIIVKASDPDSARRRKFGPEEFGGMNEVRSKLQRGVEQKCWDSDNVKGSGSPGDVGYDFVENTLRRIASPAPPSTVSSRKIEDGSGTDDSGSLASDSPPVISPLSV
jgi:hypothetical protein